MKKVSCYGVIALVLLGLSILFTWTGRAQIDASHDVTDAYNNLTAAAKRTTTNYLYYANTTNYVYESADAIAVYWTRCSNGVVNLKTNSLYP